MSQQKQKTKTAMITLRVAPEIKAAAEIAAERDHRSLTNLVEVLIMKYCESLGIDLKRQEKEIHKK